MKQHRNLGSNGPPVDAVGAPWASKGIMALLMKTMQLKSFGMHLMKGALLLIPPTPMAMDTTNSILLSCKYFFSSGVTNAANERGVLSGSLAGGSMIRFSYLRFVQDCNI